MRSKQSAWHILCAHLTTSYVTIVHIHIVIVHRLRFQQPIQYVQPVVNTCTVLYERTSNVIRQHGCYVLPIFASVFISRQLTNFRLLPFSIDFSFWFVSVLLMYIRVSAVAPFYFHTSLLYYSVHMDLFVEKYQKLHS